MELMVTGLSSIDWKRKETKSLFFRILAGLLIFSSLASESLTGIACVNGNIDALGEILKTYKAYIEEKKETSIPDAGRLTKERSQNSNCALDGTGISNSYAILSDNGLPGIGMFGTGIRQTGILSWNTSKEHFNGPVLPVHPVSCNIPENAGFLLKAADISPPVCLEL